MLLVAVATCLVLQGSRAGAEELGLKECIAANEKSGPLRQQGRLREARAQLRLCSAPSCPAVVRDDCVGGATKLDAAVPSVILAAQDAAGNDLTAVVVTLDDEPLTEKLDGKPLEVDPGEHALRMEAPGMRPIEKRLVVLEGEKDRRERFSFVPLATTIVALPSRAVEARPAPASGAVEVSAAPESSSPRRTLGLWVGGAGVLGIGVGTVAGIMTFASWGSVKNDCGASFPGHCQNTTLASSDRSAALTSGAASTVAFAVGGVALATGAVLFFTAPRSNARSREVTVGMGPWVGPGVGGFELRGTVR